ncbi:Cypemycin N-terminal methyltransferase [subsurface metagenome]
MKSDWYQHFFYGVVLDYWRKLNPPEQTQQEADFLADVFPLSTKSHLLDVPCGNGRHSLELASRGYSMVGLDQSKDFIREAQEQTENTSLSVEWVAGDMRHLSWKGIFDGAFCVGNSFGYLSHLDTIDFLTALSHALKPGGYFVLDTSMVAESLLFNLEEHDWEQAEDIYLLMEHHYDSENSCLQTEYLFMQDGTFETRSSWHLIYTVAEIRRLLEQVGLSTTALYGSLDKEPFELGSSHLLLVAKKTR